MSGTNSGRGGYQGKNFDPNYKSRFQNNNSSSSSSSSSNDNAGGSTNQGGYKGKNFDPNYHTRFANPSNALEIFSSLRPSQNTDQPQRQRKFDDSEAKNVPTEPKCYSSRHQPSSDDAGGDIYHQRKRKIAGDGDHWVCSCPPGAARCLDALARQYEERSRHYIDRLAESEHTIDVLKTTLERVALDNPQLAGAMSECYDAVEAEVIQQEYEFFQSWGPAQSSSSAAGSSGTELDEPE